MRGSPRKLLALFAAVCALALPAGDASAEHVQCGDVITADTTLDSDLVCAGDGLTIADAVRLDLAGHTIQGEGAGSGITLGYPAPSDFTGARIRGGVVRDFAYGIDADGPRATAVRDVLLEQNVVGFRCNYAPECAISSSEVRRNQIGIGFAAVDAGCESGSHVVRNRVHHNAVGVRYAGCNGTISGNQIHRNTALGVSIEDHGRVVVASNTIDRSGDAGVYVWYLATVQVLGNRITRNAGNGLHLDGDSGPYAPEGEIRDNRVVRNGADGIRTTNVWGGDTVIEGNRTERNRDDGIDVDIGEYGGPIVVRGNRAFFNLDLGIEADPGTIDGGGNRARHNGNPAQCVGVSCK
jgi:parallel beta-helix repeat protein